MRKLPGASRFLAAAVLGLTAFAAADHLPPVHPLCNCRDHSHEDHSFDEHRFEVIPFINLTSTSFEHADLTGCNLMGAVFKDANLRYARLTDANLSVATLKRADLRGCSATGVTFQNATLLDADAHEADFRFSSFAGADLRGVSFVDADVSNTNFINADISNADFSGADLSVALFLDRTTSDPTTFYDANTVFGGFDPIAAGWTLTRAACCVNGLCAVTEEPICTALGGVYLGTVSDCAVAGCAPAPVTGACCINGACLPVVETDCIAVFGVYHGDGVDCADAGVECPTACPADANGDRLVGFDDVLMMISNWGPCPE